MDDEELSDLWIHESLADAERQHATPDLDAAPDLYAYASQYEHADEHADGNRYNPEPEHGHAHTHAHAATVTCQNQT